MYYFTCEHRIHTNLDLTVQKLPSVLNRYFLFALRYLTKVLFHVKKKKSYYSSCLPDERDILSSLTFTDIKFCFLCDLNKNGRRAAGVLPQCDAAMDRRACSYSEFCILLLPQGSRMQNVYLPPLL